MIEPTPQWRFTARDHLTQWYGHVHVLSEHALGQWFCVNRHDGAVHWERTLENPNTIFGVADGVIVASQTVSRGPGTWHEGCFGISLVTGEIEWTSNGEDGLDSPSSVEGNEVTCQSGRVLAARDGRLVRHVTRDEIRAAEWRRFVQPTTDATTLYRSRMAGPVHDRRVRVEGAGWLCHRHVPNESVRDGFRLYMSDDAGVLLWSFDLATTPYRMRHCNYYAYRLAGQYVYVVASEQPDTTTALNGYRSSTPTIFHLLSVELLGGMMVQDVRLNQEPVAQCRIEDVDPLSVLVSVGERELNCYQRVACGQ